METFVDRFADAPVRHVPPDALTAVDQKILAVLRRYRLLDVPYLAALTGTPYRYLHERLKILRASNNRYVNIVEVQRMNREAYRMRPLYFELGVNGGHPDYTGTVKRLDHKAMEQHIFAEFEIGALKRPGFELIPRARSEIKRKDEFQLLSVNEAEYHKNPARRLVTQKGSHWELTSHGLSLLELLVY